jgi:hypothetical protein
LRRRDETAEALLGDEPLSEKHEQRLGGEKMKRSLPYYLTFIGVFAAALFVAAAAADAGCSPEGSWMSFQQGENGDIPLWISTNSGQSASSSGCSP